MKYAILLALLSALFFSQNTEAKHRRIQSEGMTWSAESSYFQRILHIENQRIAKDPFLKACLRHPNRRIAKAAMLALGRIGDPSFLDEMAAFLSGKDVEMAESAAFALSIMGNATAEKILTQSIVFQKNPAIRAALFLAIGRTACEAAVPILSQAILNEKDKTILSASLEGLLLAWSGASEKWQVPEGLMPQLYAMAKGPEPLALLAASALQRYKGEPAKLSAADTVLSLKAATQPQTKAFLVRALGKIVSQESAEALTQLLSQTSHSIVKIEAVGALKKQTVTPALLDGLKKVLTTERSSQLLVTALETIGKLGKNAAPLAPQVETLTKDTYSLWIRQNALKTLALIAPENARPVLAELMKTANHPMYAKALVASVYLGEVEDLEKLIPVFQTAPVKTLVEVLDAMTNLPQAPFSNAVKTGLKRLLLKNDMAITSLIAQLAEQFTWKDFSPMLATSYPAFTREDDVEVKVAILSALGTLGESASISTVESATNDKEKLVVTAAVNALKLLNGPDLSAKIPLNSKIQSKVPSWSDIQNALSKRVLFKTNRGEITIRMLPEAPVTAYQFIQFVKTGFYSGKLFHRVVPGFVSQGGDPRGDGFGSAGFLIRDEVSSKQHLRGTLGIATAGRDTGSCQFFFNQAPNFHLTGKYTLFAEVTGGLDVIDRLEVGDVIFSASIR